MRPSAPISGVVPLRTVCRLLSITPRQARYVIAKYRVPVTKLPNGRRGAPTVAVRVDDVATALIVMVTENPYARR